MKAGAESHFSAPAVRSGDAKDCETTTIRILRDSPLDAHPGTKMTHTECTEATEEKMRTGLSPLLLSHTEGTEVTEERPALCASVSSVPSV